MSALGNFTRWLGFFVGLMTIATGLIHLAHQNVGLYWPRDGNRWVDDINGGTFRQPLFTLNPVVFFEHWTPLLLGLVATLSHWFHFRSDWVAGNFARYGVFNLFLALFANFPYAGGWGILAGAFSVLTSLLSFVLAVLSPLERADLGLFFKRGQGVTPATHGAAQLGTGVTTPSAVV